MNAANLIGGLIFSCIGLFAFLYGKKQTGWRAMTLGILLMGFPYVVTNTLWLYVTGTLLTFALFLFRD